MSDFYQHIKNNLANAPTHQPDPEVWNTVITGVQSKRRWLPFPIWYIIPFGLLLLLAGGIGYYWGTSQMAANTLLEKRITEDTATSRFPKQQAQAATVLHDTLTIRDTILQFVYLPATSVSPTLPPTLAQKQNSFSPNSNGIPPLTFDSQPDSLLFFINDKLFLQTKEGIVLIPENEKVTNENPRPALAMFNFEEPIDDLFPQKINKLPKLFIPGYGEPDPLKEAFKVDGTKIGIGFQGLNFPFTSAFPEVSEWKLSADAEFIFTEKISVLTGLQFRKNKLKTEDEAYAFTFPLPDNIVLEDDFKELYLTNYYLELPILLKYNIPSKSSFSPFLMGGVLVSKAVRQQIAFEFENANDDEYKLFSSADPGAIHLSSWVISGGIAYRFKPDSPFSLFMETRFRYNSHISTAEYAKIHGLGLKIGGTLDL